MSAGIAKEKFGPFRLDTSPERVGAFARAVGATGRGEVPPTYLTLCRDGEFQLLKKLQIPLSKVLHGEQSYEYYGPIRAGEELAFVTHLSSMVEKKGSSAKLKFLVVETRVYRPKDEQDVAKSRTTMIVREPVSREAESHEAKK